MKPLCFIPAKRRSVRLPEKNIRPIAGKPMFIWTVEAALKSGLFDTVYVSTDDEEIKALAEESGANVPYLRSKELTGDTVTNVTVGLDLLDQLNADGFEYDTLYCLQPSSPTRDFKSILNAWKTYEKQKGDFLFGVTPIDAHYFDWALTNDGGSLQPYFSDNKTKLRQNMERVYRPNGAIKIANAEKLRQNNNFFGDNLKGYEMSEEQSVHVATEFDAIVADAILRNRK